MIFGVDECVVIEDVCVYHVKSVGWVSNGSGRQHRPQCHFRMHGIRPCCAIKSRRLEAFCTMYVERRKKTGSILDRSMNIP